MSCKCDTINIVNDNNVVIVSHADGRDGKSAYQQAVEGGYTGTEQEFNCSLSLLADVAEGKRQIAEAINERGGNANPNSAFTQLAQDIEDIENFPTTGFEYISEIYRPRTLMEAYNNRFYLKSITDNFIEEIKKYSFRDCANIESVSFLNVVKIGDFVFSACNKLKEVNIPNLVSILGSYSFGSCNQLESLNFPNLVTITGGDVFASSGLKFANFPSLVNISNIYTFKNCPLENLVLGVLSNFAGFYDTKKRLRNITIGKNTNINLPFQSWDATNVIAEGQSGIDELNANLRTNLLEKLYDHSTDGQTRTLRLGWLAHVTQENIDYANSKGWTLTT